MAFYFSTRNKAESFRLNALKGPTEFVGPVEITEDGGFFSVEIKNKSDFSQCEECQGFGSTVGFLGTRSVRYKCDTCSLF